MDTRVLVGDARGIVEAARALETGGLVAIPTETVYGLAGNAFDDLALAAIFDAKERPRFDPLIVHVACAGAGRGAEALDRLVEGGVVAGDLEEWVGVAARALAARFWPGPLTLVLPRGPRASDLATSGLPTVAVRAPSHAVAQALLAQLPFPVCAPSANRFGRISPTQAADVVVELGGRVPFVLDGGRCEVGVESTIVAPLSGGHLRVLRPGGLPLEEIEVELARQGGYKGRLESPGDGSLQAPGGLASHYAPEKKLRLLPADVAAPESVRVLARVGRPYALLVYDSDPVQAVDRLTRSGVPAPVATFALTTPEGGLALAAHQLFAKLRELDAFSGAEELWAEPVPKDRRGRGLGFAIQDRLTRASAPGPLASS